MLRGGLSMAIASIWASMANWSTPTILFCLLNLMIFIIFIASNSESPIHHRRNNSPTQIARSPSLLERVKSMNLSSFYGTTEESHDNYRDQYESTTTRSNSVIQLHRRPSLLQRVTSLDFSRSSFYTTPTDQSYDSHHHESEQTQHDSPSQLTRVPSLLERLKSIKFSTGSEQLSNTTGEPEPTRVPLLLDRIKSFKLIPSFNSDHHSGDTFSSHDQQSDVDPDPHHALVRDNDETNIFGEGSSMVTRSKSEKSSEAPMKTTLMKSSGKNRVLESNNSDVDVDRQGSTPATTKTTIEAHNECVNAKADDFIKRFKQQLKLQRIDSLQRFREMINRSS